MTISLPDPPLAAGVRVTGSVTELLGPSVTELLGPGMMQGLK